MNTVVKNILYYQKFEGEDTYPLLHEIVRQHSTPGRPQFASPPSIPNYIPAFRFLS